MNTVNRRLTNLENATREQDSPEHGLSPKEVLDRIYDSWVTGQPSGLPPPDPETAAYLDSLYDRIVASQQERSSRSGKP